MSAATSQTPSSPDKPVASASPPADLGEVLEHLKAIKEDVLGLAESTRKLAAGQAKAQTRRVADLAEAAKDRATEYRDLAADMVKQHPFAAVGIGVAAGLLLAALARRS